MGNNRTVGVALLAVGLGWFAAWPAFLGWMVSMEGSAGKDRPGEAAWRLWRALEILLVEPRWLASTLSVLILGAPALGAVVLAVATAMLRGHSRAPKWAAVATVSGMTFCLLAGVFHWAVLMPAVRASENREVVRASGDLNVAIPLVLGAGFVSMLVPALLLRQLPARVRPSA
jgi:hypothetical protein